MKEFSIQEAADYLGVSIRTLRRWIQSGKLVPETKGGIGRGNGATFSAEQLDEFLKPRRVQSRRRVPKADQSQRLAGTDQNDATADTVLSQDNVQKMIVPCDKLSQIIWNWEAEEFAEIICERLKNECVEGKDKFGNEIVTPYWLGNAGDYADLSPLTAFQREILFFIISQQAQGLRTITVTETSDGVTGDERGRSLYDEIYDAFEKLANRWVKVDLTPLLKARPDYRKRYSGEWKLKSPLLPCRFLEHKDKNSRSVGIELLAESPLMIIAKMKRQVLTYDAEPLAIANQNHTERVTVINNWLLRNVELRKQGRLDSNKILLKSFYEDIGLADGTKWQLQDAREIAAKFLNHLKEEKVIRGWSWEMDGTTYRAIILDYDKAAKS